VTSVEDADVLVLDKGGVLAAGGKVLARAVDARDGAFVRFEAVSDRGGRSEVSEVQAAVGIAEGEEIVLAGRHCSGARIGWHGGDAGVGGGIVQEKEGVIQSKHRVTIEAGRPRLHAGDII
jgi:hypothetical protein